MVVMSFFWHSRLLEVFDAVKYAKAEMPATNAETEIQFKLIVILATSSFQPQVLAIRGCVRRACKRAGSSGMKPM